MSGQGDLIEDAHVWLVKAANNELSQMDSKYGIYLYSQYVFGITQQGGILLAFYSIGKIRFKEGNPSASAGTE